MNLKRLKELYTLYLASRYNKAEREMIIEMIKIILVEINNTTNSHIEKIEIDRYNNKIKYLKDDIEYSFYFIGNMYYINGIKLLLN